MDWCTKDGVKEITYGGLWTKQIAPPSESVEDWYQILQRIMKKNVAIKMMDEVRMQNNGDGSIGSINMPDQPVPTK